MKFHDRLHLTRSKVDMVSFCHQNKLNQILKKLLPLLFPWLKNLEKIKLLRKINSYELSSREKRTYFFPINFHQIDYLYTSIYNKKLSQAFLRICLMNLKLHSEAMKIMNLSSLTASTDSM